MPKQPIQLVISDLDGTLLTDYKTISRANLKAISDLQAAAVVRVVEELDDLLGDGAPDAAAAVGRHDEDVLLVHPQWLLAGAQRDPNAAAAEPASLDRKSVV